MSRPSKDRQLHTRISQEVHAALADLRIATGSSLSSLVAAGISALHDELRRGQADAVRERVGRHLRVPGPATWLP